MFAGKNMYHHIRTHTYGLNNAKKRSLYWVVMKWWMHRANKMSSYLTLERSAGGARESLSGAIIYNIGSFRILSIIIMGIMECR